MNAKGEGSQTSMLKAVDWSTRVFAAASYLFAPAVFYLVYAFMNGKGGLVTFHSIQALLTLVVYGIVGIVLALLATVAESIFGIPGLIMATPLVVQAAILVPVLCGFVQAIRGRQYPLFLVGSIAKKGTDRSWPAGPSNEQNHAPAWDSPQPRSIRRLPAPPKPTSRARRSLPRPPVVA